MKTVYYPKKFTLRWKGQGTSLVVQWLRLCAPSARGPGSIPGQGTRSHIPQLRVHCQINKYF